jgi:hypothetical protein
MDTVNAVKYSLLGSSTNTFEQYAQFQTNNRSGHSKIILMGDFVKKGTLKNDKKNLFFKSARR